MWYGDSDGERAKDEEASEQPFQRFFPFFLLHTLTQYGPNDLDGYKNHQSVRNEHRHGKHETNQLERVKKRSGLGYILPLPRTATRLQLHNSRFMNFN